MTANKFLASIAGFIDRFIPKDKSIVVFSGNNLHGINGNVAAIIHDWAINPGTRNLDGYVLSLKNERFDGLKTVSPRTIKGMLILLRAYTIVLSHGPGDIYWKTLAQPTKRRIINLWHGMPLKKIGPFKDWGSTVIIASSTIERLALASCFKIDLDKIIVTGFPRTDQIIRCQKELKKAALDKLNQKDESQKWILYAPTYRKNINSQAYLHNLPDFSSEELEKILEENNACLIFRYHINQPVSNFPKSKRFIFAHFDLFPDIEPLYALADILITDYSSSIFEYLLLNRPIIGLAADLKEYSKSTGFLFDYESTFPGPIATNWRDMKGLIIEAIKNPSANTLLRKDRLRLFHHYLDGFSTERCINIICDMNIK